MRLKATMCLKATICSAILLLPTYGKGDGAGGSANLDTAKYPHKRVGKHYHKYAAAAADEVRVEKKPSEENSEGGVKHVSGGLTLLSNYSYRGITESMNMPALQGELMVSEKEGEGFFGGFWGSTVDSVTAPNGNGLEAEVYGGYAYKFTKDFTGKLGLYYMFYPQCVEGLTKDNFDQMEIIPGFTYKWFTFYVAYTISNVTGLTPRLIQELFVAPPPNGNTKGSLYTYGSALIPINKDETLKLKLWAGYWNIRHYNMLSYAHFGTGLYKTLPKNWAELTLSINVEGCTAKTKHWTNVISELEEKKVRLGGTKFWVGITKEF